MCRPCQRSYDSTLGGDVWSVIEWAAKRARLFERRRGRELAAASVELARAARESMMRK